MMPKGYQNATETDKNGTETVPNGDQNGTEIDPKRYQDLKFAIPSKK